MEQVVLVPASLYNNNEKLKTYAVTNQEFPKYQVAQNPTYQIDSLRKEVNKKWSATADSLVDKVFVLYAYQALKFTDFNIANCGNSSFTLRLCPTKSSQKRRRSRNLLHFI